MAEVAAETNGRHIKLTNDMLLEILRKVAKGPSLRTVGKEYDTSAGAIIDGIHRCGLDEQYAQAMRDRAEVLAAEILDVADDSSIDHNDKRIRVDTRKWYLSKVLPKIYGDRLNVDHTVRRLEDVIGEIDGDGKGGRIPRVESGRPVDNPQTIDVDSEPSCKLLDSKAD
ncbi:MAG: hypothetical protein WC455_17460 [Dehalococcoidia bacterium]|jgi:hypothetical protein